MQEAASRWAEEIFGRTSLGDPRRARRLVAMAASVARAPGGTVTSTMRSAAEKEGAFRFLESTKNSPDAIAEAMCESAALACAGEHLVFVAVDQTEVYYGNREAVRGEGRYYERGNRKHRGAQLMNALAVDERGVPIGLVDQRWWLRSRRELPYKHSRKDDPRPPEQRESWRWVECIEESARRLREQSPRTDPWFVMDRAGDFHGTLVRAMELGVRFTIRSSHNRTIAGRGKPQQLWPTLARRPVLGEVEVRLPRGSKRQSSRARFELRVVTTNVRTRRVPGPQVWGELSCLRVREISPVPRGQKRIEWKLLTNAPVANLEDARLVLRSYTLRWRVEEFHKTWKSGSCNIESSQLRSFDALKRWGTILSAVAVRVERLKLLSREQPELDAQSEFTRAELDAAILLSQTKDFAQGDDVDLGTAVRLVALVGGYMGRTRDGPPGSITIKRGLERVAPAAMVLEATRTSG